MRRTETINKIKNLLHRISPSSQVVLYGSQARGDARPDSDIDLLILLNSSKAKADREEIKKITYPLYDIELEDGVSISPLVYTKRQWESRPFKTPFYVNVMNEGIELGNKNNWMRIKETVMDSRPQAEEFINAVEELINLS